MNILDIAQNSGLHDYAIKEINVNYKESWVEFQLLTPDQRAVTYKLDHFLSFFIQNKAPWGKGHYICSSEIQAIDNYSAQLEIQLNSGDEILVKSLHDK